MALVVYNRVQETTTTTGTGTITLAGAASGFQSFAVVGNGNTTYYTITSGTAWEVGIGTYTSSGTTLARTTILSNSLGTTAAISLTGTSNVFVTYPSEKSIYQDASGNVGIGTASPNVKLDVIGSIEASPAATQDGIILAGRAGGTSSFAATLTPTTLTASRTITLPDATTTMVGTDATQTLTNKRVTPRVNASTANSATPTLNTDNFDMMVITGQSVAITSFTTNLTGTPTNGQKLWISITGTTAIAITWGASFESSTVTLPTTTVTTARLDVGFVWNVATSDWRCVAVA